MLAWIKAHALASAIAGGALVGVIAILAVLLFNGGSTAAPSGIPVGSTTTTNAGPEETYTTGEVVLGTDTSGADNTSTDAAADTTASGAADTQSTAAARTAAATTQAPVQTVQRGNTTCNLLNKGDVAVQGNWIYYCNTVDHGALYKMNIDGSDKQKLNDICSEYINVMDGWIYYVDTSFSGTGVYKIKTDGTQNAKLTDKGTVMSYLLVLDNALYFIGNNNLYKMKNDGTGLVTLTADVQKFFYEDNGLYVIKSDGALYQMTTDGTNVTKIRAGVQNAPTMTVITVVDHWIYYNVTQTTADRVGVYRMKTDGSGVQKLAPGTPDSPITFQVAGNWIYYFMDPSTVCNLYSLHTDGSSFQQICPAHPDMYLYYADGWIYYYDRSQGLQLAKMKPDGTGMTVVG
ncbi:MAG: DUF5050 domain-containing protein [Oscillospiraceae bacterium]|nr:DUF5050 domain-containing protein [Oscillospiraceae bacterium]